MPFSKSKLSLIKGRQSKIHTELILFEQNVEILRAFYYNLYINIIVWHNCQALKKLEIVEKEELHEKKKQKM